MRFQSQLTVKCTKGATCYFKRRGVSTATEGELNCPPIPGPRSGGWLGLLSATPPPPRPLSASFSSSAESGNQAFRLLVNPGSWASRLSGLSFLVCRT